MPPSRHNDLKNGLKSNMDRFIGDYDYVHFIRVLCLKSNMDRFIVFPSSTFLIPLKFKIQYG